MPLIARNHAGQRGVRSNTHLIVSAELRAVLACVRQTLAAAPQPVSDNPLVPQLHRTLGLAFLPSGNDASRPFLLDSQPRVGLGPPAEHKRNGTAYRPHFIVDAVLALRAPSGRVTSQKLRLQLVRSLGVLISLSLPRMCLTVTQCISAVTVRCALTLTSLRTLSLLLALAAGLCAPACTRLWLCCFLGCMLATATTLAQSPKEVMPPAPANISAAALAQSSALCDDCGIHGSVVPRSTAVT